MKITIQAIQLRSAAHGMATRDIRYYLNGLLIEATKTQTIAVGTDGRMIVVNRCEAENEIDDNVNLIIPDEVVKAMIASAKKRKSEAVVIESSGDKWSFQHDLGDIVFSPIEGRFPDWKQIFSKTDQQCEPCSTLPMLSPAIFQRGCKAHTDFTGGSPLNFPRPQRTGDDGSLVLLIGEDVVVAIMPMRDRSEPKQIPAWVLTHPE